MAKKLQLHGSFPTTPGPKGDAFTYDDFTPEQLEALKGPKGDAFTYDDFTPEQLEALRGPKGLDGSDYVLTDDDRQEIADLAITLLPKYAGGVV